MTRNALLVFFVVLGLFADKSPAQERQPFFILDMVHHNPGEKLTKTVFSDPSFLRSYGFNGQVLNDFVFAHAALTFDKLNPKIFPKGSIERNWVTEAARQVREHIKAAHTAGIKAYYFTDIIVLPKRLVKLYKDEICDEKGKISFERPKTIALHKMMLEELFETFPDLDGLVIRTGETYLNNVPYHTGNNPITNGVESHLKLIRLLREEVCEKRHKMIFYRTWLSAGMHEKPDVYLKVTDQIQPHPYLVFSVKHTSGDYQRTLDFNRTLGIGKHSQIVEVQCQREYEGKGAYPNYIADGVINGFEEYGKNKPQPGNKSLNDLKNNPNFRGLWTWSRGGGWVGPYVSNEFWMKLNTYVMSHWAKDTGQTEEHVFNQFMKENGIQGNDRGKFRMLCLLSAKAVLRGHNSAVLNWDSNWVWWMRDEFLSGTDAGRLIAAFKTLYERGELEKAVAEKYEAVGLWEEISKLSREIKLKNEADQSYLSVSSDYGLLLHRIIAEGWRIMALGYTGDRTGNYDKTGLRNAVLRYDDAWEKYRQLKKEHADCATLYQPYAFDFKSPGYHSTAGMGASVNKYRVISGLSN